MLPVHVWLPFIAAALLLALAPGPDNLFVLTQGMLRGPRAGLAVTGGLATGLVVHTAAVAFGIAALLQTSPAAFAILKLCGAAYLVWLAVLSWRGDRTDAAGEDAGDWTAGALYRRGILMNISNPKVSLFFLAFLPQFTDPGRGSVTVQILLLGGLFLLSTLPVFGGIALLAGRIGTWLRHYPRFQPILHRLVAFIFLALALHMALAGR